MACRNCQTGIINTGIETCSDSPFYREISGLPPCSGSPVVCVPTIFSPCDSSSEILEQAQLEQETEAARIRMEKAAGIYETAKRGQRQQDTYHYPSMEEVPGPTLGGPSRADEKKNIFTTAFNPANRKIILLCIAGFLLFLAFSNWR